MQTLPVPTRADAAIWCASGLSRFSDLFDDDRGGGSGSFAVSDAGFRHLVESSGDAMIVVRLDGTVAYANPAAERLFNRSAEVMRDEPFGLPLTDGGATRVDVLPRGRPPGVAEMRVVRSRWDGQPAMLASLRDVTEQAEMERSLRLSSVVFNQAAEGIAFVDHDLRLVEVNRAFAEFFGDSSIVFAGRDVAALFGSVDEGDRLVEALRVLTPGRRWRSEFTLSGNGVEPDQFVLVSAVHVVDEEGLSAHFVLLCTDISRQKRDQQSLHHEARHDGLTGLANRSAFQENVDAALARARRKDSLLAIMFLDLDGFKSINDRHGHERGDQLLQEVARRMRRVVRAGDAVSRLGGDEFTLLLEDVDGPADVVAVAEKLRAAIEQPMPLEDVTLHARMSMGASLYPGNGETADDLLARADLALYRVKEYDPGGFRFFNPHMDRRARLRREMAGRLTTALRTDALRLVFQPQVDIETGAVHSVEALLRYPGRSVGWRRPLRLLEIAEQARLLPELLRWVLSSAMSAARDWLGSPPVAINLCARQLLVDDLDERVVRVAEEVGLPVSRVVLHLPVTGVMAQPGRAIDLAARLRRRGIATCLDNLGSGSFSVAALESLAPDEVSIDRSVMAGMRDTPERCLTLKAMLAMLESMSLPVVVQGVEGPAQIDWLRQMSGSLVVQGEQVVAPLEAAPLQEWLRAR
ncbi:MAG: putative bifunctional diguanylate cyclase/phosphodiesterase [Guyparkeria sp.]